MGVISGTVWFTADWYSGHRYSTVFFAYWNTGLRILSFLIVGYATARIRRLSQESFKAAHRLSGLLPICAWCKKIRNDRGYWEQVEQYLQEHSDALFTHSICEDCARKKAEEVAKLDQKDDIS